MNQIITFTPAQLVTMILGICAGIVSISAAGTVLYKMFRAARRPEDTQNHRLTDLEARVAQHDKMLDNDNRRIKVIEDGNRVTQQALLALLSHGISGDNEPEMKNAKEKLERFLIER